MFYDLIIRDYEGKEIVKSCEIEKEVNEIVEDDFRMIEGVVEEVGEFVEMEWNCEIERDEESVRVKFDDEDCFVKEIVLKEV